MFDLRDVIKEYSTNFFDRENRGFATFKNIEEGVNRFIGTCERIMKKVSLLLKELTNSLDLFFIIYKIREIVYYEECEEANVMFLFGPNLWDKRYLYEADYAHYFDLCNMIWSLDSHFLVCLIKLGRNHPENPNYGNPTFEEKKLISQHLINDLKNPRTPYDLCFSLDGAHKESKKVNQINFIIRVLNDLIKYLKNNKDGYVAIDQHKVLEIIRDLKKRGIIQGSQLTLKDSRFIETLKSKVEEIEKDPKYNSLSFLQDLTREDVGIKIDSLDVMRGHLESIRELSKN